MKRTMIHRLGAGIGGALLIAILAIAAVAAQAPAPGTPAARLSVVAPPARTALPPAPSLKRPWMPLAEVKVAARPIAIKPEVTQAQSPTERPPLPTTGSAPAPDRPQFALGSRRLVTPAPPLAPRIPNLLQVAPRKSAPTSSGAGGMPAAAIATPPVCNVDGTTSLPMLAPFTREIPVEIAPPAAPLAFDREPYLQAANAPDDEDAPASSMQTAPGKPHIE